MQTHRPYELQEYDPAWKQTFLDVQKKLELILGENIITIEHIGSTAIEGMVAKSQVDVLVVVKDLDLVKNSYEALTKAGFTPQGREYVGNGDEYFTEDAPDGRRLVSIHIFAEDNPKIEEYRIFRDYLRQNKEERDIYITTKKRLYALHQDNYPAYDSGKKEVIEAIKSRAKQWATTL